MIGRATDRVWKILFAPYFSVSEITAGAILAFLSIRWFG